MKQIHISEANTYFVISNSSLIGLAQLYGMFCSCGSLCCTTAQVDPDISRQHSIHICMGQDVQEQWQER